MLLTRIGLAASEARRRAEREPPSCQRKSRIFTILLELLQDLFEAGDSGQPRRRLPAAPGARRDPALANRIVQLGIAVITLLIRARRADLGNDSMPVGDEDGLARSSATDVFAELVLEDLEADGAHGREVASSGYFVDGSVSSAMEWLNSTERTESETARDARA